MALGSAAALQLLDVVLGVFQSRPRGGAIVLDRQNLVAAAKRLGNVAADAGERLVFQASLCQEQVELPSTRDSFAARFCNCWSDARHKKSRIRQPAAKPSVTENIVHS
jgi:hypothetical protein